MINPIVKSNAIGTTMAIVILSSLLDLVVPASGLTTGTVVGAAATTGSEKHIF